MNEPYEKSTGAHRGYVKVFEPEYVASLRRPLVQHAIGKCGRCGSTVCESPLPHQCGEPSFGVGDYGRCLL